MCVCVCVCALAPACLLRWARTQKNGACSLFQRGRRVRTGVPSSAAENSQAITVATSRRGRRPAATARPARRSSAACCTRGGASSRECTPPLEYCVCGAERGEQAERVWEGGPSVRALLAAGGGAPVRRGGRSPYAAAAATGQPALAPRGYLPQLRYTRAVPPARVVVGTLGERRFSVLTPPWPKGSVCVPAATAVYVPAVLNEHVIPIAVAAFPFQLCLPPPTSPAHTTQVPQPLRPCRLITCRPRQGRWRFYSR